MTRVTRFAGRDPGPTARVAGFIGHLRANGLSLGVSETALALDALTHVDAAVPEHAKRALKAVCAGCREDADQFDALFDAFATLPGLRTERMLAQLQAQPHVAVVIWERRARDLAQIAPQGRA